MRISHPTVSAVLACILLSLPGSAHGQELDRFGGFLDIKGERTGLFTPSRPTIAGGWSLPKGTGLLASAPVNGVEIKAAYRRVVEQRFALLKKAAGQ